MKNRNINFIFLLLLTIILPHYAFSEQTYEFVLKWGTYGDNEGQFKRPTGIAMDTSGYIYVVGYNDHHVHVFDSSGTFIRRWGGYGAADTQFRLPFAIAIDSNNCVYVGDLGE